jgi:S-DNA-T family DNA segregation ATPase FtsK/SpoIIIE
VLVVAVVHEPNRTPLHLIIDELALEIGRDCLGLLLTDPKISRRHLSLEACVGGMRVTDLGSTNGTRVDDRPLTAPAVLRAGQVVHLGSTTIAIAELSARPVTPPDHQGDGFAVVHIGTTTVAIADQTDIGGLQCEFD